MRIQSVSVSEVEYTSYRLATKFMGWDENIPDFSSRFPHILESCLGAPFQTFNQKTLYPGLAKKAAILFYLMNKNHPFANGNKRIAVMTLLYFLYKSKKWLRMDHKGLYSFAVRVAESAPRDRERMLEEIEALLKVYLVSI